MAITSTGENSALVAEYQTPTVVEDKTALGKDDFLKLLLVELQHQDPTEPMDSDKILSQTSQLATLEASQNTNDALEKLAVSMESTQEFSVIGAIGKRADLGSDAVSHEKGSETKFEIYFPEDIANGVVVLTDTDGNEVATLPIEMDEDEDGNRADKKDAGVYAFSWDGLDSEGNSVEDGIFHVNAKYNNPDGVKQTTRLGAYPIESVRFEEGKAYMKLGSSYVALEDIAEVY